MKKVKFFTSILLIVTMFLMGACSNNGGTKTASQEPPTASQEPPTASQEPPYKTIKIGLITSLTTAYAQTGMVTSYGAELAINEINNNGGINGMKIELITEDAANNQSTVTNAFYKVDNEDVLAIIGPPWSNLSSAITPLTIEEEIPMVIRAVGLSALEEGRPWTFRGAPNSDAESIGALNTLIFELGCKKIGILYSNDELGNGCVKSLYKAIPTYIEEYGIEIVGEESHSTDSQDMTAQLLKLKDAGCEGIVCWNGSGTIALVINQRYRLDMTDIPIITNGTVTDTTNSGLIPDEAKENVYAVLGGINNASDENESRNHFNKEYKKSYDIDSDSNSAIYYDIAKIFKETLEKMEYTGDIVKDRKGFRDTLAKISNYEGITNVYTFDDESGESCSLMEAIKFVDGSVTHFADVEGTIITD